MFVSAATHDGLESLIPAIFGLVDRHTAKVAAAGIGTGPTGAPVDEEEDLPVLRPRPTFRGSVEREGEAFRVTHRRAIRLANGSDLSIWKAQMQFHEQLRRMGIVRELERHGVVQGATVRIGDKELAWE